MVQNALLRAVALAFSWKQFDLDFILSVKKPRSTPSELALNCLCAQESDLCLQLVALDSSSSLGPTVIAQVSDL